MTAFYEVWDDGTGNRVGGTFASEAEAVALLDRVLHVNGEDAVSEMAIMECRANAEGKVRRRTILEGSNFVERQSGPVARAATIIEVSHAT